MGKHARPVVRHFHRLNHLTPELTVSSLEILHRLDQGRSVPSSSQKRGRPKSCSCRTALWPAGGSTSTRRSGGSTRSGCKNSRLNCSRLRCRRVLTAGCVCVCVCVCVQALEEALLTSQSHGMSSETLQDIWKHQVSFSHHQQEKKKKNPPKTLGETLKLFKTC